MTALAVTFALYRVAALGFGLDAATALNGKQGPLDAQLIGGAALFGAGWGASGVCPGPHLVTLGAYPTAAGPLVMLAGVVSGMRIAGLLSTPG
jgi:uncharacterized membrane protein YedE/YeeE